jgi:signal transduction histidine kinase
MVVGLVGTAAALLTMSDPGVTTMGVGSRVDYVSPAGIAWRDGIRAGNLVIALRASDEGGWSITTKGDGPPITTSVASNDVTLRNSALVAAAGLLLSALAFAFRGRWRGGSWAAAAAALILASTPLSIQGDPELSTLSLAAALVVPAVGAIGYRIRSAIGIVAVAALVGFLAVWTTARLTALGDPTSLEDTRSTIAFVLTALLAVNAAIELRGIGSLGLPSRQSTPELAGFAVAVGLFAILGLFLHVDAILLAGGALVLFLAYPRSRRAILRAADALFLGDVKRQAAIEASEGERARLAADLHDVPIQELSAVIARLELLPEAAGERAALRRIAAELRSLTSELRPPVLDDLGLPLAIESLADQYARDGTAIRVAVDDRTRPEETRDPRVELAIYRVTEEAVRNAMAHAEAQRVDVTGVIGADAVQIEVRDDGRGLDAGALERARRAGHAGLLAMRHRAEAIGAQLALRSELGVGVSVSLAWHR